MIALCISLFVNRVRYQRVSRCHLQPVEDQWMVDFPGFAGFRATCEPVYRSRWLLLLRLDAEHRRCYLPVFSDSVKPGEFRRLHMLLR